MQALALVEHGVPPGQASHTTKISVKTIQRLRRQARARGFDPAVSSILKLEYVEDAPRSGRPPKLNSEIEDTIVASFVGEGEERERVTKAQVAEATGVSTTTIRRVLASRGVVFEPRPGSHAVDDGMWKMQEKKVKTPRRRTKEVQGQNAPGQEVYTQQGEPGPDVIDEFGGRLDPLLTAEARPEISLQWRVSGLDKNGKLERKE